MSDIPGRSKNNAPTTEKQQKRAHHAESKGLNGASQAQGGAENEDCTKRFLSLECYSQGACTAASTVY